MRTVVRRDPAGVGRRARRRRGGLAGADRGRGIAADERHPVFDRCYRAAGADGPSGAGLGLWIVGRTVEAQGGSVTASAREGGGTTVQVRLPAD